MNIFITSDHHFNHAKILEYVPKRANKWNDYHEMNEALIHNWNSVVGKNDTVIHVGDFCFFNVELVGRLNGNIELHLGNHDYKSQVNKMLSSGFINTVSTYSGRKYFGKNFHIQHHPSDNWLGKEDGTILIHGHTHGNRKTGYNEIDVGVDTKHANYFPMEISQVHRIVMEKNRNFK